MDNSILNQLPIDPAFLIIGLSALTLILLIVVIICMIQMKKLYRRYDFFMRGKDAETLEGIIMEQMEDIAQLKSEDRANKDSLRNTNKNYRSAFQKFGLVKYNAFKGMGGNLSFAMSLLDYTNSGFVLNSVHSREGCYVYIKEVERGETEVLLGSEEKEALERALGYHS
ncbi:MULTISPECIES: DUF4446 family protein [Lacrimispora]|uniref:Uncharacterized protein DUF4446 n=2 Tax=Lacrimispora TaxID=2719231 RepID=A0A2S6HG40_9FIRM|nr:MULTISPECIES: DUF4446 family protein [Clostridia]MBE5975554.1 DUF4446 family protein [Paenibacillaceae bacterium]MBE5980288.1 DUF4446 family protein [Paenibacillaceae bacterium]MBE5983024.1 DUF4446 family protein [Paenibacillaceae bacterium]MBE5987866.1 DUF4446 family protein [Paenibacillaceae bacterium]MBE5993068.1 DUF4446 family protein [Paenibacillaceae bacterium]